jgi:hypothetical protein
MHCTQWMCRCATVEYAAVEAALAVAAFVNRAQLVPRCALSVGAPTRGFAIGLLDGVWEVFQSLMPGSWLAFHEISFAELETGVECLELILQHDSALACLTRRDKPNWLAACCSSPAARPEDMEESLPLRAVFVCRVLPLVTAWFVQQLERKTPVRAQSMLCPPRVPCRSVCGL